MEDLCDFKVGKDFYQRMGRAWKPGYHSTTHPDGKSSMIAAMANFLGELDLAAAALLESREKSKVHIAILETTKHEEANGYNQKDTCGVSLRRLSAVRRRRRPKKDSECHPTTLRRGSPTNHTSSMATASPPRTAPSSTAASSPPARPSPHGKSPRPSNPPPPFHLHKWDLDHRSPLRSPPVAPEPPSSLSASRRLSPIARFIVDVFSRNRGDWGPPVVAELGKLRRVTTGLVAEVLKAENNPAVASKLFAWAGRQKGYRHNYGA
ncbi:hypothetical protein NL676_034635 [Syzygium grande]|nr:hypothetical protein NL676_034635 [Syzygium grande]